MKAPFDWKVLDIGVKVAALMTEDIILRRLPKPVEADKIMLPGRCRADIDRLSSNFGVPFLRGPDELKDLPAYFGRASRASDMTKYDIQIFAEIVDASALSVDDIVKRAQGYAQRGANVIDLGCLPDTPFPHLEEAIGDVEGEGLQGQRRFRRRGRAAARRQGGRRLPAQPQRGDASRRRRGRLDPGAHPQGARRYGLALPRHGRARRQGPLLSRRSRARSHQFRLHALARALCRGPPQAPRRRDLDGHRQSHRADRRRHDRHHRRSARHRVGAPHQECARGAGEPAYAPHRRGARPRAPHHVCRAAPSTICRRTMPTGCSRCIRASRSR